MSNIVKFKFLISFLLLTGLLVLFYSQAAAEFDEGMKAYENKDYSNAFDIWLKDANNDDSQAQNQLGIMYSAGLGVDKDDKVAVKWFRAAAKQDDISGMNNLGYAYKNGTGIQQDYSEALKWFEKAASLGSGSAANNIAFMYKDGEGVISNEIKAYQWWKIADLLDAPEGSHHINLFLKNMGQKEIKKGEKLANEWIDSIASNKTNE